MIEPYYVAVCQAERIAPRSGGLARLRKNIESNLNRYCNLIDYCCGGNLAGVPGFAIAGPVRLVTFGEFSITGPYMPADPSDHRFDNQEVVEHLTIRIPGEETDVLANKAKEFGIYIAAVNFEADPDWPDLHFNTGFIINPDGKIILKYRKILTNQPVEIACSPHDVMNQYLDPITREYDPFPVVETDIGRLAVMICNDLNAPKIPRIYSLKGADVVMHLTSGMSSSAAGWHPIGMVEAIKRVRAYDNAIYFINSNWGPEIGSTSPKARIAGYSTIIDYMGNELARAQDSNEQVVRARIDIDVCRQYREQYYKNPVTQMRTELYVPYYSRTVYPPNTFLEAGPIEKTLDSRQQSIFHNAVANLKRCYSFYKESEI